jgi:hypothetical protein
MAIGSVGAGCHCPPVPRRVALGFSAAAAAVFLPRSGLAEGTTSSHPLAWLVGRWTGTQVSRGLEAVWTEAGGRVRGIVEEVGAKPTTVATYELTPSGEGWSLLLQEGRQKYRFEGRLEAKEQLRFERRLSKPGPFVVEIGMDGKNLIVGKLMGPQHGAAVRRRMWFERAAGLPPR